MTSRRRAARHPPPAPKPVKPPARARAFTFGTKGLGFLHSANAQINLLRATVIRVGLALIGGDFTGEHRGDYSIDLQGERVAATQVASGAQALCLGNEDTASGAGAVAVGIGNTASGVNSVAVGTSAQATADHAQAFGSATVASGLKSLALGYGAVARVPGTTVIAAPLVGQKGDQAAPTDWFSYLGTAEVILRMGWIDAKAAAADYYLQLPAGLRFWVHDLGIIVSDYDTITAQPWIHFGRDPMSPQIYVADVQTVGLTSLGMAQVFAPAISGQGEYSLLFGIVTPALGVKLKLSPYWRGMIMESS